MFGGIMRQHPVSKISNIDHDLALFWTGQSIDYEVPKTNLYITDPPYNIGVNYGAKVSDKKTQAKYHVLIKEIINDCYEKADDDAHLFLIHYPESIAEMWHILTEKWEFKQWLSWNYPTNTGFSKSKFTRAHRTILWLTKGNPHFDSKAVTQRFKNLSVKKVKNKMAEGVPGVSLYDWWVIPQVKNISKEYKGYKNQIPSELIRRIILSASKPNDWVADPFAGSFSTARTSLSLGRRTWSCDINPDVEKLRPTLDDYISHETDEKLGNIDSDDFDDVLKYITQKNLNKVLFKLLIDSSENDLIRIIGKINGPRIFNSLHGTGNSQDLTTLRDFSVDFN